MDSNITFPPPPPRARKTSDPQQPDKSPVGRVFSVARRGSSRISKSLRGKKKKPGLVINTNVSRHNARAPPQEIKKTVQPVQPQVQPWQQTQPPEYGAIPAPLQSPSKFPAAYIDATRRETLKASPAPQDLYFAPPPGSLSNRASRSSVYSKAETRKSKTPSRRPSNATVFEEDGPSRSRSRATSRATAFEEDGTIPTFSSHHSKGWWNVITTPFENKSMASPKSADHAPAVPSVPQQWASAFRSANQRAAANHSTHPSSNSNTFNTTLSPGDREIPIMLDGDDHNHSVRELLTPDDALTRSRKNSQSTVASPKVRNPFSDARSPPSGNDEFSPAGIVAGQGNVTSEPTVVNVYMPKAQPDQSGEVIIVESHESLQPQRRSFRDTLSRTVRYLNPRSPRGVQLRDDEINEVPQTAKSVRFAIHSERFSAPPPPSVGDYKRSLEFEEFDIDDKPQHQEQKRFGLFKRKPKHQDHEDNKDEKKKKKKMSLRRRCCFCCLCILIFGLICLALIITLAVLLSRKHNGGTTVVWTNVTYYPGMPTGPLTIARPNLVASQSGCVQPSTVWSCAVPKEQQAALQPNDPSQPNFVFNIIYDNSTSIPITNKRSESASAAALVSTFMKSLMKRSVTPSPAPPTLAEQNFLGNNTDNNVQPFEGETTPFFISLIIPGSTPPQNPTPTTNKVKRDPQSAASATANIFPSFASIIPTPSLNPDGSPPPANLLPSNLPSNQPIRLYNRGKSDEHYGFYTYFDRSIFLKSNIMLDTSEIVPADQNGGSTQLGANVRCTFSDTRLLVQIWTRKNNTSLLPRGSGASNLPNGDWTQPGSFPYPVSVTMDRHGGSFTNKMAYCWGMTVTGALNTTNKKFQLEDRKFGGTIVNPSTIFTNDTKPIGGIDGGTGGCFCRWQNWA